MLQRISVVENGAETNVVILESDLCLKLAASFPLSSSTIMKTKKHGGRSTVYFASF